MYYNESDWHHQMWFLWRVLCISCNIFRYFSYLLFWRYLKKFSYPAAIKILSNQYWEMAGKMKFILTVDKFEMQKIITSIEHKWRATSKKISQCPLLLKVANIQSPWATWLDDDTSNLLLFYLSAETNSFLLQNIYTTRTPLYFGSGFFILPIVIECNKWIWASVYWRRIKRAFVIQSDFDGLNFDK